ncbi:hypothetical protein [Kitasatospora sp. NPDC096204]|uniref:hypothetical protein n=1 Tax=Kitasatospora sp. NPDC096204 TaxID=3364094 RepID=UPI0038150300
MTDRTAGTALMAAGVAAVFAAVAVAAAVRACRCPTRGSEVTSGTKRHRPGPPIITPSCANPPFC